ncbi:S41 family peptidase [Undibacterium sp.]|uniref:S41 family peptidase n=1 Tax=Undibacterium sp. TaxID=1914977 RepID=UPI003751359C
MLLSQSSLKPLLVIISSIFIISNSAMAQMPVAKKDLDITANDKQIVIQELQQGMSKKYVFPEVADKVNAMLKQRQKNGDYDKITSGQEFAKALTEHLQQQTKDKHLRIHVELDAIPVGNANGEPSPEEKIRMDAEERQFMQAVNYGVERIERLGGNVGYFELRGFGTTEIVGHAISAAMTLLNASDALIIDLRKNGGGSPQTVALIASYFTDPEVHLNDIYNRSENKTTQIWSTPYTAGPRYDKNKQVYILTSQRTFSAAEDLTYTLQSLKRSITVGEVTGGGAHPVDGQRLHPHFMASIPFGRSINPITKTNWEGTGVQPDILSNANDALRIAHRKALENLLTKEKHPGKKADIQHSLDKLTNEKNTSTK